MNDQPQYAVIRVKFAAQPFFLVDAANGYGIEVDRFRSEAAAHHSASMLNRGIAVIDPHAIVGCKVIAR